MTLDESGKQNEESSDKNSSSETTDSKVEEAMQWSTENSKNNKETELNKAAKRTFDEICDNQLSTDCSETTKSSLTGDKENDNDNNESESSDSNNTSSKVPDSELLPESVEDNMTNVEKQSEQKEPVKFKVVYAKELFEIILDQNETILSLKNYLQKITSVASNSQKLCYKGNLSDNKTLKECGIKNGVKLLMIGSKANDILAVASATKDSIVKESKEITSKEPLCQQKQHKKIIEKGLPAKVMPAWIGEDCPLPSDALTGMLNKYGNKVRLTFKLEQDEVWISTKERTQKIQMTSIKTVISEPIEDYQNYHIMGLQIGPTEASRIWFYWVPAQYIRAIKNVIFNT